MATAKFCRYCGASLAYDSNANQDRHTIGSYEPSLSIESASDDAFSTRLAIYAVSVLAVLFLIGYIFAPTAPRNVERPVPPVAKASPPPAIRRPPEPSRAATASRQPAPTPAAPPNTSAFPPTRPDTPVAIRPEPGLVAYYAFNGDALDHSGQGNHGTVHGNLRYQNGNAVIDDDNTYVTVSGNASLEPMELTLAAWVTPNGSSAKSVGELTAIGFRGI